MKQFVVKAMFLNLFLVILLTGCGGGKSSSNPSAPASSLTATGSLGKIVLNWPSTSGALGYNIYRSKTGSNFAKINTAVITATSYTDALNNTDKTLYYYYVKAVNDSQTESGASNTVRSMQGNRLNTIYDNNCYVNSGEWYVAEGIVAINSGNLTIADNGELYVLDNAVIRLKAGTLGNEGRFIVEGMLRVLAVPQAPATFTTTIASPPDNQGFALVFDGAVNYNPASGDGTIVQNTIISNTRNSSGALVVRACSPRIYNSKITGNSTTGTAYFSLDGDAIIERCRFDNIIPSIDRDLRGSAFLLKGNTFRNNYYSLYFNSLANPGVDHDRITGNDFDGSKPVYLRDMTGGVNIPLGGNYWGGGTGTPPLPSTQSSGSSIDCNFSPALSAMPNNLGPTW